jgi:hypothetical protein
LPSNGRAAAGASSAASSGVGVSTASSGAGVSVAAGASVGAGFGPQAAVVMDKMVTATINGRSIFQLNISTFPPYHFVNFAKSGSAKFSYQQQKLQIEEITKFPPPS